MDIAGHVPRQVLSRYSHIRMEAKRKALDAVGTSEQQPSDNAAAVEQSGPSAATIQ